MRDIGYHFPDTAGEFKNIDSKILLKKTVELIATKGYKVGNIDATICAERPKLKAHIPLMQETMATVMGIDADDISIKATTTEKLGFTGRRRYISLCYRIDREDFLTPKTNKYDSALKNLLNTYLFVGNDFCMAQKSELKFSKDGKFKIVQFTDVHFKYGNRASDIALERINQVLDDERPDLVIFTGDVVYSAPADSGMLQVLEPVVKRKLPFVVTFGNHDNEQEWHGNSYMILSVKFPAIYCQTGEQSYRRTMY